MSSKEKVNIYCSVVLVRVFFALLLWRPEWQKGLVSRGQVVNSQMFNVKLDGEGIELSISSVTKSIIM